VIKKDIKYTDYNGVEKTEPFYFNLSKGELVLMEMSAIDANTEGMNDKIKRIERTRDGRQLAGIFKEIVESSYGVKSHDGSRFIKDEKNLAEFKSSEAWSEVIVSLATDAEFAIEFINGLMPQAMRDSVEAEVAKLKGEMLPPVAKEDASVEARKRSEAQLQGHQQKREPQKSTVEILPDLPSETEALVKEDLSSLSKEELIARMQNPA
jgi:hypothetical protein